jgi:murein endopeptidase
MLRPVPSPTPLLLALLAVLLAAAAAVWAGEDEPRNHAPPRAADRGAAPSVPRTERGSRAPVPARPRYSRIRWRRSRAVGDHESGRLVKGVRLPAESEDFFTWDPVLRTSPNRHWRRLGTDRLIRLVLGVLAAHRADNPRAPRLGIGDLSRPHGGDFGARFGYIGHVSHQNGLDADIYYPRHDRRERAPRTPGQVDRRLSQDLVDRFVAAGARKVFVGPSLDLEGPRGVVVPAVNHDNHLHVRLRTASSGR